MNEFYKTIVTVEIEVEHQYNPEQVKLMLFNRLKVPAITNVKICGMKSNYQLHKEPSEELKYYPAT